MGLFGNLFKNLKSVKVNRSSQDKKISFEPFNSQAEKQYYEMAYGLLSSSDKKEV